MKNWHDEAATLTDDKRRYVVQRILLSRQSALQGEVSKILDVGCGEGSYFRSLVTISRNMASIFGSISAKATAGSTISATRYSSGLPYPDEAVDLVHSSELSEHLLDTEFFLSRVPPDSQAGREVGGFHTPSSLLAEYCGVASMQSVFLCWLSCRPDWPLRYFYSKTISVLAHMVGFRNIKTNTTGDKGGGRVFLMSQPGFFKPFQRPRTSSCFWSRPKAAVRPFRVKRKRPSVPVPHHA